MAESRAGKYRLSLEGYVPKRSLQTVIRTHQRSAAGQHDAAPAVKPGTSNKMNERQTIIYCVEQEFMSAEMYIKEGKEKFFLSVRFQ